MHGIPREQITGLVLAGGRGSRMGGVDKGLQLHHRIALAQHALQRLAPQVGPLLINANRNLDAYATIGAAERAEVLPDALPDYAGPLAGFLAGLERCATPWLVTVPCDSPLFPVDLVERLAQALEAADAEIAMPATLEGGVTQVQPVFCLMKAGLKASLAAFTASGQRKIHRWTALHRCVEVAFDHPRAFFNANTAGELLQLQSPSHAP